MGILNHQGLLFRTLPSRYGDPKLQLQLSASSVERWDCEARLWIERLQEAMCHFGCEAGEIVACHDYTLLACVNNNETTWLYSERPTHAAGLLSYQFQSLNAKSG